MYNHYTPQSDGSYRRSTIPEPVRRTSHRSAAQPRPEPPRPEPPPRPDPPPPPPCQTPPEICNAPPPKKETGFLTFLRDLLPREIDSIDMMVILLLILMNKEDDCDGISPLLTLALYFLL